MRPAPCLTLCLLTLAALGCGGRSSRPDASLARLVEQEEARRAARVAVAAVDVDPFGLASAAVALEAMGVLYVPGPQAQVAPPTKAPASPGWREGAPPSWGSFVVPMSPELTDDAQADAGASADEADQGDDESRPGRRRGNGRQKPRVRLRILDLKINDRPVSFSGSVKNLDSVQFRMTIKM